MGSYILPMEKSMKVSLKKIWYVERELIISILGKLYKDIGLIIQGSNDDII